MRSDCDCVVVMSVMLDAGRDGMGAGTAGDAPTLIYQGDAPDTNAHQNRLLVTRFGQGA